MKADKEIKKERKRIIRNYMDGNLNRFLRRHQKQSTFEGVFVDYITKWRKNSTMKPIVRQMEKKLRWPIEITNVVNIMRTLYMYYNQDYGVDNAKMAWDIYKTFERDIEEYNKAKYNRWVQVNGYNKWPKLTPKKALKEQKARGYIKLTDYEDFNRKASHIISLVDDNYVYPMNFHFYNQNWDYNRYGEICIYIGLRLVGVQGYTKTVIPNNN